MIHLSTTKAGVHKYAAFRTKVRSRMREAIQLVVARGVTSGDSKDTLILSDANSGADFWLLKGSRHLNSIE